MPLQGLGFWSPAQCEGFQALPPSNYPFNVIFLLKALAIVAAIEWATERLRVGNCLAIFMDNSNTVDMFYTIHTLPLYNPVLTYTVNILISARIDLRVCHIPRILNTIANHISCWKNEDASTFVLGLRISTLILPQVMLGTANK